jgi:hypothetical protein
MGDEKRQAPRAAKPLMARYRAQGNPPSDWFLSPLRDLSRSGARFLSEGRFAVGTSLEFHITLPMARQPVPLVARIVRTAPGPIGCDEYSVTFEAIDSSTSVLLETAVQFFLKKSHG